MKIIRLLIIFVFLTTGIKTTIGQSQLLAVENATWIIGEISTINYPVTIHYYTYQIEGDTTVNSIEYKKVYKYRFQEVTHPIDPGMSTPTYPMHIEPNSKELFGLVRDYQQKVYAIRYGEINAYSSLECPKDSEYELFDYTWQVGDTVQLCIQQDMPGKVTSIELNYPHFNRKTYFVGNHRYYEGIGTQKGLFEMIIELVKLWDGTVLYDYCVGSLTGCGYAVDINENERPEDRIKIYPNPAVNGSTTIRYFLGQEAENVEFRIYDLSGVEVDVFNGTTQGGLDNEVVWNCSDIVPGVYRCMINVKMSGSESKAFTDIAVIR